MSLGLLATPTVTICKVAKMVFNVAPGNFYLSQYLEYQEANGTSATVEALAGLAGGTDAAFVTTVLTNLGLADDAGASAFLTSAVAANGRGAALEAAITALNNVAADDATYGASKTAFDSAVTTSVVYSTNTANNSTDTTTLAQAITPEAVAAASAPENLTIALSTSVDTLSGGAGNDTFTALQDNSNDTYTSGDTLNGGAGTDRLNVIITDATPNPIADLNSVEEVYARTTAAETLQADGWTGVTHVWNDRSSANLTVDNLANLVTVGLNEADGNTDIQFQDSVVSGSADALNIVVQNSGSSTSDADLDVGNQSGIANASIETVTITAQGSAESYLDIAGLLGGVKTITIDGSAAIDLAAIDTTALTTVDAGNNSGGVTLDLDAGARDLTVTGGSGDDEIDVSGTYTSADTLNGGDGTDVLVLAIAEADPATAQSNVTNFETIALQDDASNDEVDVAKFGDITTLRFDADSDGTTAGVTVTGLASGHTIQLNTGVTDIGSANAADVNISDASGTGDSLTLDIDNKTGNGAFDLDITGVETLTIDASTSNQQNTVNLTAAQLTALNVTGASASGKDAIITFTAGGTVVSTIDASSTTGSGGMNLTLSTSAVSGATVTGSKNADTINGSSQDDEINGGAGGDTIDGKGGSDAINVGANDGKADTVTLNETSGKDTITGFNAKTSSTAEDFIDITFDGGDGGEVEITAAAANGAHTSDRTYVIEQSIGGAGNLTTGGSEEIADFTDVADVAAYLGERFDNSGGGAFVAVANDGTSSYVYYVLDAGTDATLADEVTLIGVVDAVLEATDVKQDGS